MTNILVYYSINNHIPASLPIVEGVFFHQLIGQQKQNTWYQETTHQDLLLAEYCYLILEDDQQEHLPEAFGAESWDPEEKLRYNANI